MKVSIKLAVAYLISQKGKSLALITSISLAVMLIFTLNVIPETQSKINIDKAYKNFSDYHVEYSNLSDDVSNNLKNEKEIKEIYDVINFGNIVDKNGVSINLNSYNKDFLDAYGYKMIKGSFPKNDNEIVIEEKALREMNLSNELNQEINFNVVKKYVDKNNENQIYTKPNKFKLVGIIQKPEDYYKDNEFFSVKGFTKFSNSQDITPNELLSHSGVLKFNTENPSMTMANKFIGKYRLNIRDFELNVGLSNVLNEYQEKKLTKFSITNKLIPMISAGLVIYNIFNIILIDKINQIGVLRAIGMKKKNIKYMMIIQSVIVLIIGLVIGFGVGYVVSLIGINSIYGQNKSIYVSKESIIEPLILATIVVFICSILSTHKASKISPVEAIKTTNRYSKKQKDRCYHKLIKKVFGLTGEMAFKNILRDKSKTILSILSISLAGSLFISKIAFYNDDKNLDNSSLSIISMGDTDVILKHNSNNSNEFYVNYNKDYIDNISNMENIREVIPSINTSAYLKTNINSITDDAKSLTSPKQDNLEVNMGIKGYNKDFIKSLGKYIKSGGNINDEYIDKNDSYPSALISNYFYSSDQHSNDTQVLKKIKVGDILKVKVCVNENGYLKYKDQKIRVAGLLNKDYVVNQDGGMDSLFQVILNENDFKSITNIQNYNKLSIKLDNKDNKKIHKDLEKVVKNSSFKEIESKYKYEKYDIEQSQQNKKEVLVSVILTLIISVINIICIIKANIMIRIKELSTLRAIGMSIKNIKKMIIKESIIYAIFSTILSAISATLSNFKFAYMINKAGAEVIGAENSLSYSIPINEILQFGIVTIIICILATYLSANKLVKLSIVEGLKIND
ncbi:ABC transporter permease [Romboutsia lituseburensis]|uniref:Putative ABC transport system permease protein n=1 Tax=Romboutsia lituseburensis DSM 797 TaxID=1121325 RepID=A0A1G9INS5_9FIRM|nr:ABC transporter permease [Romboutsia lituseburensis]CEH33823.1 Efflux ABC transporter, permease protein [Romboutsia lituseburensis]SDL26686.1 putative ABC transport system permease protein [Romboutsia lituseburensis DSM 797]